MLPRQLFQLSNLFVSRRFLPKLSLTNTAPTLNTQDSNYVIKPMSLEQFISPVVSWQNSILTIGSDHAIFADDPSGWFVSYKNNQLIGSCASFKKGNGTAWLGYYFVQEAFRRQKYGKMMFDAIINHDYKNKISQHTFVCLENLAPMYQRDGFKITSMDSIFRAKVDTLTDFPRGPVATLEMNATLFNRINSYTTGIHGFNRETFLAKWLAKDRTTLIVAMQGEEIVGYNVLSDFIYPANDGIQLHQRMAPLYANNATIAEDLIQAGLKIADRPSVFIDADNTNPQAASAIDQCGLFSKTLQLARMSKGDIKKYYDEKRVFSPAFYGNGP